MSAEILNNILNSEASLSTAGARPYAKAVALAYQAELQRWRTMDELPEDGQRIEVAYRCSADWVGDWSAVENFDGDYLTADSTDPMAGVPIAWRPAGELPELPESDTTLAELEKEQ